MLSSDKSGLLRSFLGSLPGDIAARLARAVETDRLMDGTVLPHETILDGLRPVLRGAERPERMPTPLRQFCRPFEDILSSEPRRQKQKASIARASILPVWQWLSGTLLPQEALTFAGDMRKMILARKSDEVLPRAALFWAHAGEAIQASLRDAATRKSVRTLLKDEAILADAEEMALLLTVGSDVLKIQDILPRPVPHLDEDLLWQLRAVYDELVARNADAAPYVAVIAMNRLARPWEALRLPLQICRQTRDTMISKTDMGLVGEILFTRMDNLRQAVLATRHPLFDAATLLDQVSHFAKMSSAIVKEIEITRDGEWGQRLLKERAAVGNAMDVFMERAPREFAAALPMQKTSGPKTADFSRPVDVEKLALARRYADLVTGSRNFAAAGSFAAKQKTAFEELCNLLRRYNEDLVKELRSGEASHKPVAESQLLFCADLTHLLFSEEEAELLRRRGRAALSAAA